MDRLAEVKPNNRTAISGLVDRARRRADGGLIIAVLGQLNEAEVQILAALRASGTTCIAFVIDTSTWLNLPADARAESDRQRSATALGMMHTGWRVVGAEHGAKLAALWPHAGRGSAGFAWRAALAETALPTGGSR
jgi:hypothetical protein